MRHNSNFKSQFHYMKNFTIKFIFLFFLFNNYYCSAQVDVVSPKMNQLFNANNPIEISWNKQSYTTNYQIQLSNEIDFILPIINITTIENKYITSINQAGDYFVRVKSNTDTRWSNIITIKVVNISDVPGMISWFSADSLVGSSNGLVNSWTDIKNNARIAIQPNSVNQPLIVSSISTLNSKPGIEFNGNDAAPSYLDLNLPFNSVNYSLYVLRDRRAGNTIAQYVFGSSSFGGFYSEQAGSNQGNGVFLLTGNMWSNEPVRDTNFRLYLNTDKAIYKNNTVISNTVMGTQTSPEIKIIGARSDGGGGRFFSYTGTISEFLYFDRILDSTNNSIVSDYFISKYGTPINLGFDTILGESFCDSVIITTPNKYVSYLWSNGKTTQSIKVLPNNSYSVTVKDVFGNISTDDINVFLYKRLGNKTIAFCQGNSATIDLQTPANFNVLWNDNTTNKIKTINSAGQYTVKVTDAGGCFVYDTINVIVDNPKLNPVVTGSNISLCKNEKLFLNTATAFDTILWSTGSTDNFIPISTDGNYSVYARTTTGCVLNQSFNVNIAGNAPVAAFNYAALCQNNTTQFSDSSTITGNGVINTWKWDFSNGTSSTQQNPTTIFNNTGTFSAALKVTTNQGCTDSIYKTFIVNRRPSASFSNRKSCEGNPTIFEDLSTPNAASITNRNWNFANLGVINDIQNPAFVFPNANTYNVKLIVTNSNGCVDSITNSVKVNQSPISNFSFDAVCGKSPVNFRFLATVPTSPTPPQPTIATWQWDFGDNTFNSAIKDVSKVYNSTGTYTVKLLVTSSDQCPNTIEKQVKVYEFPIVDFDISPTQCAGKDIQFTDRSQTLDGTPITSWKWFFSGQSTDTLKNTSYAFANQGNYTVQLTASNAVGCTGTKLRSVAVSSLPIPKFTFSPQNGLPPLIVNYTNQSPINGNYLWNYGDGSPIIQGFNPPTHTYNTKGSYPITLTATNFLGCTDTLTKFILVDKAFIDGVMTSIIITPNGDYYQIQATILNASNIEIRDLGLTLQLGGGAVIKEDWSGSLLPGQTTIYNFIGQIKISDNSIPVICTSIDNVNNNSPEDKIDNNSTCKEVRVGSFDVLNVFPNPAVESINFGVMLPKDGKITIGFIDVLGQTMFKKEFDGIRGYNNLSLSTTQLNAAIYVAAITFDGETLYEKFMRKDRK